MHEPFLTCRVHSNYKQYHSPSVSGGQLQSSVERPCPGESVTFTCTLSSTAHQWVVSSLNIDRTFAPSGLGNVILDSPFEFAVTEVVPGTSITSTATVNATADLNGTLVLCQDGNLVLQGQNSTLNLRGEHGMCVHVFGTISYLSGP